MTSDRVAPPVERTFADLAGLYIYAAIPPKAAQGQSTDIKLGYMLASGYDDAIAQAEKQLGGKRKTGTATGAARWRVHFDCGTTQIVVHIRNAISFRPVPADGVIVACLRKVNSECEETDDVFLYYSGPGPENCVGVLQKIDPDFEVATAVPTVLSEAVTHRIPLDCVPCETKHDLHLLKIPGAVIAQLPMPPRSEFPPRTDAGFAWAFTPGVNACDRVPAIKKGQMVLAWGQTPDLRVLTDSTLRTSLRAEFPGEKGTSYRTGKACERAVRQLRWIQRDVRIGDVVVLREGRRFIHAIGEVTGEYVHDFRDHGGDGFGFCFHSHRRAVNWWKVFDPALELDLTVAKSVLGDPPLSVETLKRIPLHDLIALVKEPRLIETQLRKHRRLP